MTPKVPTMDMGSAMLGISVAETFRRKRKITSTTRHRVSTRVNFTSATEALMETERSYRTCTSIEGGSWDRSLATMSRTAWATSIVLVPGWRWTARVIDLTPLYQLAERRSWTPSTTFPSSLRNTGAPLR